MPADSIHHFEIDRSTDQSAWTPVVNPVPGGGAARSYDTTLLPGVTYYRNTGVTANGIRFPYNIVSATAAAAGNALWTAHIGGPNTSDTAVANEAAIDSAGNIFIGGYFAGTVTGQGSSVSSDGLNTDCLLAKFTSAGVLLWIKRFGGLFADAIRGIAVDASGNVLVVGNCVGTVDFGGGNTTSVAGQDGFLAKYSPTGAFIYAKRFAAGSGSSTVALRVAVDAASNVYATVTSGGTVDFGGGGLSGAGFLVKYDSSGAHVWSRTTGWGNGITLDENENPVVSGFLSGSNTDLGAGAVTAFGTVDIFLARYNKTNGAYIWSNHFGGPGATALGAGVDVDGSGNILLTGTHKGTVDYGNGHTVSNSLQGVIVLKFNSSGVCQYARAMAGSSVGDGGTDIVADSAGNFIVTGATFGGIDLNGDGNIELGSSPDIFIAKYNPLGVFLWGKRVLAAGGDSGNSVAIGQNEQTVILAGNFGGTADFGGAPPVQSSGSGFKDALLVALNP